MRLVLELDEQVVEAVESFVPGALERAHPVVDGPQRRAVDPVPVTPSVDPNLHEVDGTQHTEMLRHLRLAEAELFDQVADGRLPGAEGIEEVAPARFGDGVERVGGRGGAGHVGIICRYRNVSTRLSPRAGSMPPTSERGDADEVTVEAANGAGPASHLPRARLEHPREAGRRRRADV